MNKKPATITVKDEYVAFIKDTAQNKYKICYRSEAHTLERAKVNFERYRNEWESYYHGTLDFNDVVYRHRTVITTTTEWEEA